MKRPLVLAVAAIILAWPLSARTSLINGGMSFHGDWFGIDGLRLNSLCVSFVGMGGEPAGFSYQVNPYFGLSFSDASGGTYSFTSENGDLVRGFFTVLGYGAAFDCGKFGLVVGGGC